MLLLTFIWALAEGSLFFLVADVPISWIGLRRGYKTALAAAAVAALAAPLGGLAVAWATRIDPAATRLVLLHVPGVSSHLLDHAVTAWSAQGWLAMLNGSFGGVPYKLFAHAAGISGTGMAALYVMSVVARLPRFVLVACLSGAIGKLLPKWRSERKVARLFIAFWTIFYCCYFMTMAIKY